MPLSEREKAQRRKYRRHKSGEIKAARKAIQDAKNASFVMSDFELISELFACLDSDECIDEYNDPVQVDAYVLERDNLEVDSDIDSHDAAAAAARDKKSEINQ